MTSRETVDGLISDGERWRNSPFVLTTIEKYMRVWPSMHDVIH